MMITSTYDGIPDKQVWHSEVDLYIFHSELTYIYRLRCSVRSSLENGLLERGSGAGHKNSAMSDLSQKVSIVRAAWSGSALFAYGYRIRYDPTLVDLTSNFFVLFTNVKVYLYT